MYLSYGGVPLPRIRGEAGGASVKYDNWQHDGPITIAAHSTLTAPTIRALDMPPSSGVDAMTCNTYFAFEPVGPCNLSYQIGVTNPSDPTGNMPIYPWWGVCHIQDANMRRCVQNFAGDRILCRIDRHDIIDPFRMYPAGYPQPPRQWEMKAGLNPVTQYPRFVALVINNSAQPATIWNPIFYSEAR